MRPCVALFAASLCAFPFLALTSPVLPHELSGPPPVLHESDISAMSKLISFLPEPMRLAAQSEDGFFSGFLQSLMLILACELGDRTFFVAAILAMKSSRLVVWSGALTALAGMTILSAAIGKAFPLLLDKKWTGLAAAILFAYFGVQLLRDWWRMRGEENGENEELAEVEEELNDDEGSKKMALLRAGGFTLLSPIFVKSFTMTGLAEWGDRSQIATIALAASRDLYGVILGGVLGHAFCTGLAVVGGRLLATRISEKMVALTGGLLFLSFAVLTASGQME